MTRERELEQPLRAWRTFRDVARATRTLAAAQAMQWAERARHAELHAELCRSASEELFGVRGPTRARMIVAVGTDLGLCGGLNREVASRARAPELLDLPGTLGVVIGARLAGHAPLPGAIELATPSSLEALELRAAEIADLCAGLPEPLELLVVSAKGTEGDGHARVELRRVDEGALTPRRATSAHLDAPDSLARHARELVRHAQLIAVLARALCSEHEARWRTMSRAFEAANRRIAEQELRLRKLASEHLTQEMLEVRQGRRSAGRPRESGVWDDHEPSRDACPARPDPDERLLQLEQR